MARMSAVVLASSGTFEDKVTVRIEDRRHSRGVIVATFGRTKLEANEITRTENGIRLGRKNVFRGRVISCFWVEIEACTWAKLLNAVGVNHDPDNGTLLEGPVAGPPTTPIPPAEPCPDLRDYHPYGVGGGEYDHSQSARGRRPVGLGAAQ